MRKILIVLILLFSNEFYSFEKLTIKIDIKNPMKLHYLPRFWTNTGLCPWGNILNATEISNSLLSNDMRINLELIGALPNNGLTTIRIHWLLQLIDFIKFNKFNAPEYNFSKLDKFLKWVNNAKLSIGFEFMGNPNGIFTNYKNTSKGFLWEDISYQIAQRYLKRFGVDTVLKWKFESWNEPDLKNYNLLQFNKEDYITYITSLRNGLNAASRTINDIPLKLYGPAGLFKKTDKHPLCWSILELCEFHALHLCPFNVITFHRKGNGNSDEVLLNGKELIKNITNKYPSLKSKKFANDEADPIAGWSTPRPFQSDIRYAIIVLKIIVQHWHAMINDKEFKNFESISHDNAFLSYWPNVFDQRTLFARFQMNNTKSASSQFIQKPVYVGLGLLGNLGKFSTDVKYLKDHNITILTTTSSNQLANASYFAILLFCEIDVQYQITFNISSLFKTNEDVAFIVEALMVNVTDPVKIWNYYGKSSYPNSTILSAMRSVQGPLLLKHKNIKVQDDKNLLINLVPTIKSPWIILLRICNHEIDPPFKPRNLRIRKITDGEVMIIWSELYRNERCLKTYEIYFSKITKNNWTLITSEEHVPYLSYHFHPNDTIVEGYYKIRGIDVFERKGEFSKVKIFPNKVKTTTIYG